MISKIVNHNFDYPLNTHFLITNRCNLNCPKCYYNHINGETIAPLQGAGERLLSEIPYKSVEALFKEWAGAGVRSVAIGGGEPMLHPDIVKISKLAKQLGFHLSITTNGTVLRKVTADRIHISYDALHGTRAHEIQFRINEYKSFIPKVGINHVVTSWDWFGKMLGLKADTYTLLLEKPIQMKNWSVWKKILKVIGRNPKFWVDACIAQKLGLRKCMQGITSMSLNHRLEASRCSNVTLNKARVVRYTTLKQTWSEIRNDRRCLLNG